jgi:apolipoprotein N-acyltransferase
MLAFLGSLGGAVFIIGLIAAVVMRVGKKPQHKKVLAASMVGLLVMLVCLSKDATNPKPAEPVAATQAELAQIEIKIDAQDMFNSDKQPKQKVVVYAQNTSDKTFKGTISVTSLDVDGKSLGRDYIYIEGLEPGKNTYAILWLRTALSPSFETSTKGEFM